MSSVHTTGIEYLLIVPKEMNSWNEQRNERSQGQGILMVPPHQAGT